MFEATGITEKERNRLLLRLTALSGGKHAAVFPSVSTRAPHGVPMKDTLNGRENCMLSDFYSAALEVELFFQFSLGLTMSEWSIEWVASTSSAVTPTLCRSKSVETRCRATKYLGI